MDEDRSGWRGRLRSLRGLWRDIAQRLGAGPGIHADLPASDAEILRDTMRHCLDAKGGDVSARARAAQLGRTYLDLSPRGRHNFLKLLAHDFDTDPARIDDLIASLRDAKTKIARKLAERRLKDALTPPRLRLLTQFTSLPEGVKFLVDMRAELVELARADRTLCDLSEDLKGLLSNWFDIGFLELQRITWQSPARLLEKIIDYEAVHAIQSWTDLKNRLDSDRRLYAFFHPRMRDEPLIFVEVALTQGMTDNIQQLLDVGAPLEDPDRADTAIFYSINNAQSGLAGISFGNFLIKRVVDDLAHEFPKLKCFATLSPIPGFCGWLAKNEVIANSFNGDDEKILRLVARYLVEINPDNRRARDPVAHFHLSNGARIERLNLSADRSPRGQSQSCGVMVNYLYKLSDIEANHEAYHGRGKIAVSPAVKALLKH